MYSEARRLGEEVAEAVAQKDVSQKRGGSEALRRGGSETEVAERRRGSLVGLAPVNHSVGHSFNR